MIEDVKMLGKEVQRAVGETLPINMEESGKRRTNLLSVIIL